LEFLRCPYCSDKGLLDIKGSVKKIDHRIQEGILQCMCCDNTYPVHDYIPSFVEGVSDKRVSKTIESFGHEWNYFCDKLGPLKEKFLEDIPPINEEHFKGKIVLDAGCGMGRLARLASKYGAAEVFACDLSNSVHAAYSYTEDLANVHVIQADLHYLPFAKPFNIVYSLGVLHHIPDGYKGFSSIVSHLKEHGSIAIWVYAKENNTLLRALINPIRLLTRWLGNPYKHLLSVFGEYILRIMFKAVYLPINSHTGLSVLRKYLYYNDYFKGYFFGHSHSVEDRRSVLFDFLSTEIVHYISHRELKEWFCKNNIDITQITFLRGQSWAGVGKNRACQHSERILNVEIHPI
jgi:2-polyprenyl-3-methyl-5-hydroxy-6-metoxy-1,4-benzoquinol methylase